MLFEQSLKGDNFARQFKGLALRAELKNKRSSQRGAPSLRGESRPFTRPYLFLSEISPRDISSELSEMDASEIHFSPPSALLGLVLHATLPPLLSPLKNPFLPSFSSSKVPSSPSSPSQKSQGLVRVLSGAHDFRVKARPFPQFQKPMSSCLVSWGAHNLRVRSGRRSQSQSS